MAVPTPLQEPPDFSLVLGGPLCLEICRTRRPYRPYPRAVASQGRLLRRFCWVPLAVFSEWEPSFLGGTEVSFFAICSACTISSCAARADPGRGRRSSAIQWVAKALSNNTSVGLEDLPKFYAAIDSAMRAAQFSHRRRLLGCSSSVPPKVAPDIMLALDRRYTSPASSCYHSQLTDGSWPHSKGALPLIHQPALSPAPWSTLLHHLVILIWLCLLQVFTSKA